MIEYLNPVSATLIAFAFSYIMERLEK